MGSTGRAEWDKREMSVTGRLAKRPVPDKMEAFMNSRQRRRAWRHERRQNERIIAAATGSNYRTSLPASLYAAGHRKSENITAR